MEQLELQEHLNRKSCVVLDSLETFWHFCKQEPGSICSPEATLKAIMKPNSKTLRRFMVSGEGYTIRKTQQNFRRICFQRKHLSEMDWQ
ncbi:hypothetical protein NPIL_303401 [Nephila pilipes]|uniref:Uncharacterized protein n=1 Tax=Nephila pilipes TaxID=299642 RepID=A0A8X6QH69_NEPPI|nr:hypothetical protein NPIL_303401 [Nephila pilipes]